VIEGGFECAEGAEPARIPYSGFDVQILHDALEDQFLSWK
jgi:hypothetical protein